MHRNTFIAALVFCIGFLTLAHAQNCGAQYNNQICASATDCCSSQGFCGSTEAYCGTGCQSGFGASCLGSTSQVATPSSAISSSAVTTVPTETSVSATIATTDTTITAVTTTAIVTTTTITTIDTITATTSSPTSSSSSSSRGTMQLQPTGKPNGANASQDKKGVESRLALVVVFLACLLMI